MKKFLLTSTLILTLAAASAFAATKGVVTQGGKAAKPVATSAAADPAMSAKKKHRRHRKHKKNSTMSSTATQKKN
jgi:hypothetical protein